MIRALVCALALLGCSELGTFTNSCTSSRNCDLGRVCVAGECVVECYLASDCESGACTFNRCALPVGEPSETGGADGVTDASPDVADAQRDSADPDASAPDAPDGPDARAPDGAADARRDARAPDGAPDGQPDAPTDAAPDAPAADGATDDASDASPPDSAPDGRTDAPGNDGA